VQPRAARARSSPPSTVGASLLKVRDGLADLEHVAAMSITTKIIAPIWLMGLALAGLPSSSSWPRWAEVQRARGPQHQHDRAGGGRGRGER
jgi:hypothetical protein